MTEEEGKERLSKARKLSWEIGDAVLMRRIVVRVYSQKLWYMIHLAHSFKHGCNLSRSNFKKKAVQVNSLDIISVVRKLCINRLKNHPPEWYSRSLRSLGTLR